MRRLDQKALALDRQLQPLSVPKRKDSTELIVVSGLVQPLKRMAVILGDVSATNRSVAVLPPSHAGAQGMCQGIEQPVGDHMHFFMRPPGVHFEKDVLVNGENRPHRLIGSKSKQRRRREGL